MKILKLISGVAFLVLLSFSCSSDNSNTQVNCEEISAQTLASEDAFNNATAANHTELCNAYKAALQNQINSCGDTSGDLQAIIDDLGDCILAATPSVTVTVGTLAKTFETNLTVTIVGTTRKVKVYDDVNGTDFVYFEIQQGATGSNIISNFNIHLLSSDYNPMPVIDGGNWTSSITTNTATKITGTFFGYVTSPTTGADLSLTQGSVNVNL
jgi:hypothetical protein